MILLLYLISINNKFKEGGYKLKRLTYKNMLDIINGSGLLGAGGGGSMESGLILAEQIKALNIEPILITVDELKGSEKIATVAGMGAPTAMLEKRFDIESINALELLEKTIGSKIDCLIPVETGAFNTMVPIYTGAKKSLPVLDADGAGRAVPELEMLMFHFYDIPPSPFAIADKKSNSAVVYTENSYDCENIARSVISALGMSGGIASYVMDGNMCKRAMIPGTVSIAEKIGVTIREAKESNDDFIKLLIDQFNGYELIRGRVRDMTTQTKEGFDFGRYIVQGSGEFEDNILTVEYKNENMIAKKNGKMIAMAPDLICSISVGGQALTNADLKEGMEIAVLAFPCHAKWRELKGYKVFKHVIEKLGYNGDYVTLEELNKN